MKAFIRTLIILFCAFSPLTNIHGSETYDLNWMLPEGDRLVYQVIRIEETPSEIAGDSIKHEILNLEITIVRDGVALLDTCLDDSSRFKIFGKDQEIDDQIRASYEIHTLLDHHRGIDPYGVMPDMQRNFFIMMFPRPESPVSVKEKWKLPLRLMGSGTMGMGDETSVGIISSVKSENNHRIAHIQFQTEASLEATDEQIHEKLARESENNDSIKDEDINDLASLFGGMEITLEADGNARFDLDQGCYLAMNLMLMQSMKSTQNSMMNTETTMQWNLKLVRREPIPPEDFPKLQKLLIAREKVHQSVQTAKSGDYEKTLAGLKDVIEMEIYSEHPWLISAQIYMIQGKVMEAAEAIGHELEVMPGRQDTMMFAISIYDQVGDTDKSNALKKKLGMPVTFGNPEQEEQMFAYFREASEYRNEKDYSRAVETYEKILSINPDNETAHLMKGIVYMDIKEYDKAMESLETARSLDPKFTAALENIGEVHLARGELKKALEISDQLTTMEHVSYTANILRGEIFQQMDRHESAVSEFSIALAQNDNTGAWFYLRGVSYMKIKKYDAAVNDFDTALKITSECGSLEKPEDCLIRRAECCLELEQYGKTLTDCQKIILMGNTIPLAYYFSGVAHEHLNHPKDAEKAYSTFVEMNPDNLPDEINAAKDQLRAMKSR